MTSTAMGYGDRFDQAVALVVADFRPVFRKQTRIPYITHLFAVTALVGTAGGDEDQMIAALLHDWLEDIDGASSEVLRERFGARVADMVEALSDTQEHPKPPWQQRKDAYIAKLRVESPDVKLICCADKLHNVRSIVRDVRRDGLSAFDRFSAPRERTVWYYQAIVEALSEDWNHWLLDELRHEVDVLGTLKGP